MEYGSKSIEEFVDMDSREDSDENSSVGEDENNESAVVPHSPTRGDCIMGMASVLEPYLEQGGGDKVIRNSEMMKILTKEIRTARGWPIQDPKGKAEIKKRKWKVRLVVSTP